MLVRAAAVLIATLGLTGAAIASPPPLGTKGWTQERVVASAPFKAVHGLAIGPDQKIYAGSLISASIYRVDPQTGTVSTFVGPPLGAADDLRFGPDAVYWTDPLEGTLSRLAPGGTPQVIAHVPGLNGLAFDRQGRLFGSQVFSADGLWAFDPQGKDAPRRLLNDLGGFNGIAFGPDGRLCGGLWFKRVVACIDVDTLKIDVVAEGFQAPAAVQFNSKGELYAIDNATGEIFRIDPKARQRTLAARVPNNLDNLTFDADGQLYVSNMVDNAIFEVDLRAGRVGRAVVSSPLTAPGGLAVIGGTLFVADTFSLRRVELASGAVSDVSRNAAQTQHPTQVAAAGDRLATASLLAGQVFLWDLTSQTVLAQWSGLKAPSALAVLDADRIVVAQASGELIELDRRAPASRKTIATGLSQPMGLLRAEDGWYVSVATAGELVRIAPDGTRQVIASGLTRPEGLASMSDGRIAVADTGTRRLLAVNPTDGTTEVLATELPIGGVTLHGSPPGSFPTGLAAGPDGSLYMTSDQDGGILRFHR